MANFSTSSGKVHRTLANALVVFIATVAVFWVYVLAEKRIDQANTRRLQVLALADELRQSSDDLTRMARTYVVTGDETYRKHYEEILGIRNGTRPRPIRYHDVYWDLVRSDDLRPRSSGPPAELLQLIRNAGVTRAEMVRLIEAKTYSDELATYEIAAMNDVVGARTASARQRTILRLHDAAYHEAKFRVMQPIAEATHLIESRVDGNVDRAKGTALFMRLVLIVMCCLQIAALWRVQRAVRSTLGTSVDGLHDYIVRIGAEREPPAAATPPGMPGNGKRDDSILGWLVQLQARLRESADRQRQAEKTLAVRNAELESLNRELQRINREDPLTRIQYRLSANHRLQHEFHRLRRNVGNDENVAVLFVDIDHFKRVNDAYGHETGDMVLKQVALVLEGALRKTDFLARFGGEEFLILLPDTGAAGAMTFATKVRTAIEAQSFPTSGKLTVSIGVALMSRADDSESDAVHRADVALYRAKSNGRNRVELADQLPG